jgi:hypothetical protein
MHVKDLQAQGLIEFKYDKMKNKKNTFLYNQFIV